jgi:2-polyprenyl-3-methyl-5-hydroxy-6-metoxy-1,4-benzoquinol methylase
LPNTVSIGFMKLKNPKHIDILKTHDVGIRLPMNTKYITGNPIGRWLIGRFVHTLTDMAASISIPKIRILDVGCGEGMIPRQLRRLWPSAIFHGLDIDIELLSVARYLVADMECVIGEIYEMPWTDSTYDLVCCTEVLEHLTYPQKAISEIIRIGRGYFLFSVPHEPLWRIANLARGSYFRDWGNSPGHVNHWNDKDFVRLLSGYAEVLAVKRPFPWTIVLCRKQ